MAAGDRLNVVRGEWDDEGVYFYQAYRDSVAAWAIEHQTFGGPDFNPERMTWIKPSLAWMLYRSGYGQKHGQTNILKVKLPHSAVASLLEGCTCQHGGGGTWGRVQWDPARDLLMSEKEGQKTLPRKCIRDRAIQIGLKGHLSRLYVDSIISIEDVTALAGIVKKAHDMKTEEKVRQAVAEIGPLLPVEREYIPKCTTEKLVELGLMEEEK